MTTDNNTLVKELNLTLQNIEQLVQTVNTLSHKLGLGRKVRLEDFDEAARKALSIATKHKENQS